MERFDATTLHRQFTIDAGADVRNEAVILAAE